MTDISIDKPELDYLLLKKKDSDVDWYDFIDHTAEFSQNFDDELKKDTYNTAITKKFWGCIQNIKSKDLLDADIVTEQIDPLLVINKAKFDFVYFSVVHRKSLLYMGCWLCMPHAEEEKPHIMCCLLHATRIQKLSEWQIDATDDKGRDKEWGAVLNLDGSLEFS